MLFLSLFPKLLIAGGSSFLGTMELPPPTLMNNHTLAGEKIPAVNVVCRDRWGTPMLPNGKGGYSLISPIKKELIAQSLWIPPVHGERPMKVIAATTSATASPAPQKPTQTTATSEESAGIPR